ncbi:MAG: VWA domain-containing protein [Candidatus Coatesbacteria bacterium]|nr:VWA domain-containing protein [Candidatus Coatesbacteria bacterium]
MDLFNILNPYYLLLLFFIPVFFISFYQGNTGLGRIRSAISLFIRILIYSLIILAISQIEIKRKSEGLTVFYVIDRSLSIPPNSFKETAEFITNSTKEMGKEDRIGIVLFGQEALMECPPFSKNEFSFVDYESKPGQDGTNIFKGLELALAALPQDKAGKVVLISDGQETEGKALEIIGRFNLQKVPIDVIPLSSYISDEVAITSIRAPWKISEDQPFNIDIVVSSPREMKAVPLSIFQGEKLITKEIVDLKEGKNRFRFSYREQIAGIHNFRAIVQPKDDNLLENNQAIAPVQVKAKPRILFLDETGGNEYLTEILQSMGRYYVTVLPGSSCPLNLVDLENYDLIILNNVDAPTLGEERMKSLKTYVEELGGGLLMIGGSKSYGVGGYFKTPIEEVLPVRMDVEKRGIYPSSALILVIDKSGSMGMGEGGVPKIELAKEAAILTAELLGPNDYLGVVAFDGEAKWVIRPIKVSNKDKIIEEIASLREGGGTNMYPALDEAYKELSNIKAFKKHMITLTDGQTQGGDFQNLASTITNAKITLSTVGIGKDADVDFLQELAKWGGGKFYFSQNVQALPQIFTQEAMRAVGHSVIEERFIPKKSSYSEILSGLDKGIPPLFGYNATTLKSSKIAQSILITHKDDPLLAIWNYGIGKSAAFTSDVQPRWGKEWTKWPEAGGLFKQLARSLSRSESEGKAEMNVSEFENGKLKIQADLFDDEGKSLNLMESKITLISPDGKIEKISMKQEGLGQYAAELPNIKKGTYLFKLTARDSTGNVKLSETIAHVFPYSKEFSLQNLPKEYLSILAKETKGIFKPESEEIFRTRPVVMVSKPVWEYLLVLALLLFPLDVAIRRIIIGRELWEKIWVFLRSFFTISISKRKEVKETEDSLKRLLDKKKINRDESETAEIPKISKTYVPKIEVKEKIQKEENTVPKSTLEKQESDEPKTEENVELFTKRLLDAKKKKRMDNS